MDLRIQVVEHSDGMAAVDKFIRKMGADEPCSP